MTTVMPPAAAPAAPRRLRRDKRNGWLGGVCAGIAEYFDLDPALVRLGYILLSVLSFGFPGTLVYIIMWIVVPAKE